MPNFPEYNIHASVLVLQQMLPLDAEMLSGAEMSENINVVTKVIGWFTNDSLNKYKGDFICSEQAHVDAFIHQITI